MEDASRIRVVVIGTSQFEQAALPPLIEADPELEVAAAVAGHQEGLRAVQHHDPDVVLLSLTRHENEGLSLLQRLVSRFPRPVVALVPEKADPLLLVRALEHGAVSCLSWEVTPAQARLLALQLHLASRLKAVGVARVQPALPREARRGADDASAPDDPASRLGLTTLGDEILNSDDDSSIETLTPDLTEPDFDDAAAHRPVSPLARMNSSSLIRPARLMEAGARDPDRRAEVVVLGGGEGTPGLLRQIVTRLPSNLNLALLAVVRLSAAQLELYGERLGRDSAIRVAIAQEGDAVRPGQLLLAPADKNMGMVRTGRIPKALVRLMQPEPGVQSTPSLDVSLRASAAIYGANAVGVVLSGLGLDGVAGAQAIKGRGGIIVALDPRHALVPSTNVACLEAGVLDEFHDSIGLVTLITRLGLST